MAARSVYNALGVLHSLGFVRLNDANFQLPRVKFLVKQDELYRYQVKNKEQDMFIKLLLRSYGGMFEHYAQINLKDLAARQKCRIVDIEKQLSLMGASGILDYLPGSKGNSITYLIARPTKITFDKLAYHQLRNREEYRKEYIAGYELNKSECRENYLLKYFGEHKNVTCGKCDVCRLLKKAALDNGELSRIIGKIKEVVLKQDATFEAILNTFGTFEEKKIATVVKWLLENEYLIKTNQIFTWNGGQE